LNYLTLKKEYFFALIILLYILYDSVTALITCWNFTTDDAYISWIYARHLLEGQGLLWNNQLPVVEGYSNMLWVLISALIITLKLPLLSTIKLISCACFYSTLFFLYRLSRLFFSPLLAILPVFIFSHYIGVVWWTVSGLETILYCALSVLATWQCAVAFGNRSYDKNAWIITNSALFCLALTRFEGLVYCIPLAFFIFCHIRNQNTKPSLDLWVIISLAFFLIPYSIYFTWRILYFGQLIPNTYACKGLFSTYYFIIDREYFFTLTPLIILALPYFLAKKDCKHVLLWVPSVLYCLMLWKADPVVAEFQRLFLAPFALFCILPVLGTQELMRLINPKIHSKLIISTVILLMTFLFIKGNNKAFLADKVSAYQERTKHRLSLVTLLNQQAEDGDEVLITDCGLIPFAVHKKLRFLDMQCLNNAFLAEHLRKNQINQYATYLIKEVKPRWIIANYYPWSHQEDYVITLLREKKIFAEYDLIITLKSNELIYRLYKRKLGLKK
jgi:hypothetical protein